VARVALASHFAHQWTAPDETYFTAVKRLPPGRVMRVTGRGRAIVRYWDPAPPEEPVRWINEGPQERFGELFGQAVGRCLELGRAAVYLSGGLDSVSVTAMAADRSRGRGLPMPLALSVVPADPSVSEEAIQRAVAAELGLPQVLLPFEQVVGPQGVIQAALELSAGWPWPLMHPGDVVFYNLGREGTRRGGQVLMTGMGGDEWLAVSPLYTADLLRAMDVAGLYRLIGVSLRSYRGGPVAALRTVLWLHGIRPLLSTAARTLAPGALRRHRHRRISRRIPGWVAPDPALRRELEDRLARKVSDGMDAPEPAWRCQGAVRGLLETELEDDFEKGRRLGARVLHPFWDADLVDFMYRVPPALLSEHGLTKSLVRWTLARRFPGLGFERQRKLVLYTFYKERLLAEGPAAWRKMGSASSLADLGIIDAPALDKAMAAIFSGAATHQFPHIWDALNLEAWVRPRVE
jgi:asparagine synthetase B (glutamine-hydrolysing)